MRSFLTNHRWLFAVFAFILNCGCLSIGGKVVNENPDTEVRLKALEARVSSLEQSILPRPH